MADKVKFPMPNTKLHGEIVVASVWYGDNAATVLTLGQEPPFFAVSVVALNKEYTVRHREQHMNIVPAVEAYTQWGGDY